MHFAPNTLISITELTRRFRVLDTDLDTWCKEGILPEPHWIKGRRYWQSDQINLLINGCVINTNPSQSTHSLPEKTFRAVVAIVSIDTALYLI